MSYSSSVGHSILISFPAKSYLSSHTSSTTRYTTWFGTYSSSRHSTVLSHFSKISGSDFSSFTYDCTCTESDTYAYVYADNYGYIYLCGAFWDASTTGTDSRGGTIIHEVRFASCPRGYFIG